MEMFFQKGLEYAVKLPAIYESMALPNCKEIRYIVFSIYFSTVSICRCCCKRHPSPTHAIYPFYIPSLKTLFREGKSQKIHVNYHDKL